MIVILDWNLPDTTRYHLCQEMQRRINVFVVMVSSRTDQADRLKVLSAGADDYICKPFGLAELAIRIEVVLRRMRCVTPSRIVFDRFAIDPARREVTLNDTVIRLTAMEFKILHFLASHPGESWSRQQIIEKIWGWKSMYASEERVVDVHIAVFTKIRGRCWEESPLDFSGYVSCQPYLIFLRKAISARFARKWLKSIGLWRS